MAIFTAGRSWKFARARSARCISTKSRPSRFTCAAGKLLVRVKESPESPTIEEFELVAGECMDVPIGLVHQMEAIEDAELFEFSTQHFDSDSHRLVPGD